MLRYVGITIVATMVALSGCAGDKGDTGATGATGMDGAQGPAGPKGSAGPKGDTGDTGPAGEGGPAGSAGPAGPAGPQGPAASTTHVDAAAAYMTNSAVKHVVIIFGENVSFDHYFGTYPTAANGAGEVTFKAATGTGKPNLPNNLTTPLDPTNKFAAVTPAIDLLGANPNFSNATNGTDAANPFRLGAAGAATKSMGHNYLPEQQASDNGQMDAFPFYTGVAGPPPGAPAAATTKGQVMAYYDGNTVTALWNYAQQGALNDNSWSTVFGPSTPGAINLIAGQTNGFSETNKDASLMGATHVVADGNGGYTMIGDTDPLYDVCSTGADQNLMAGKNIGDFLNAKDISWGFFEGGFDLTMTNPNGTTGCGRASTTVAQPAVTSADYIPHHQPFQYYKSTANTNHARPSSVAAIGHTLAADGVTKDPANHQYDSHDFFDALNAGNFPAVSYLKAAGYQDGHPGYSSPVDEQNFIVSVVNAVKASPEWDTTAIIFAYDDSDGWYDHQAPTIVNRSNSTADGLNGPGSCTTGLTGTAPTTPLLGNDGKPAQGRCGYGTRLPLLVLSPLAKPNYIDHTLTDQTSILRFVEDNWLGGQRIQPGGSFDTIAGSIKDMFRN